jgi:hypothetical protein
MPTGGPDVDRRAVAVGAMAGLAQVVRLTGAHKLRATRAIARAASARRAGQSPPPWKSWSPTRAGRQFRGRLLD